jgi:NTP pyrophosphatase (non-canonical NTP hydrolase)
MDLKEYTPLALRTENIPENLTGLARNHYRLQHATLGLASEFNETTEDGAHLLEEIGDWFWYLNLLCDALDTSLDDLYNTELSCGADLFINLGNSVGIIADKVKRHVFYGKEIERDEILDAAAQLMTDLIALLTEDDIELEQCLEANIRKLEKRYPNLRFEQDKALNRNLEDEKRALDADLDEPLGERKCQEGETCESCQ